MSLQLPEGVILPNGIDINDLTPDPAGRFGHYLHEKTGDVFAFGVSLEDGSPTQTGSPTKAETKATKTAGDLTGTKVKFPDGTRAVVTETGNPAEGDTFFVRVQTEGGEEREVKAKADIKPMTKAEIAAWDKEVAPAE